jgi:hypothetical protein
MNYKLLATFYKNNNIPTFKIQNSATCTKVQVCNCCSYVFKEKLWELYLLNLLLENGNVQLPRHKLKQTLHEHMQENIDNHSRCFEC